MGGWGNARQRLQVRSPESVSFAFVPSPDPKVLRGLLFPEVIHGVVSQLLPVVPGAPGHGETRASEKIEPGHGETRASEKIENTNSRFASDNLAFSVSVQYLYVGYIYH